MIPMVTIILATCGIIALIGWIIFLIVRKKGERLTQTPDEEETQRILNDAFGQNMRWGGAGGVEAETHDHSNNHTDSGSHSNDTSSSD